MILGIDAGTSAVKLAVLFFPEPLMRIFSNEEDVIAEGVRYLQVVGYSYLFMSITMIYLNIMRSVERVIISTVVYSGVISNIFPLWEISFAAISNYCINRTIVSMMKTGISDSRIPSACRKRLPRGSGPRNRQESCCRRR